MKTQELKIIRKYIRQSKSKWREHDDSSILLLATVEKADALYLSFERTIYLHRDDLGRWLGISLSNQLQIELHDGKGKFRDGLDMLEVLLKFNDDIEQFWKLLPEQISDDFESIFGLDPFSWLDACRLRWNSRLRNTQTISDSQ